MGASIKEVAENLKGVPEKAIRCVCVVFMTFEFHFVLFLFTELEHL